MANVSALSSTNVSRSSFSGFQGVLFKTAKMLPLEDMNIIIPQSITQIHYIHPHQSLKLRYNTIIITIENSTRDGYLLLNYFLVSGKFSKRLGFLPCWVR